MMTQSLSYSEISSIGFAFLSLDDLDAVDAVDLILNVLDFEVVDTVHFEFACTLLFDSALDCLFGDSDSLRFLA